MEEKERDLQNLSQSELKLIRRLRKQPKMMERVQRILEIAPQLGYRPRVAHFPLSRLMQADEIIICNSLYGAWQVKSLNEQHWQPQPLAAELCTLLWN